MTRVEKRTGSRLFILMGSRSSNLLDEGSRPGQLASAAVVGGTEDQRAGNVTANLRIVPHRSHRRRRRSLRAGRVQLLLDGRAVMACPQHGVERQPAAAGQ